VCVCVCVCVCARACEHLCVRMRARVDIVVFAHILSWLQRR